MANIQINQLPAGTLPLTGSEILPVDQGASTVQITVDDVVDYVYENGPTLDQVLDAGNTSTTPLTIGAPSEFTTINPGIIDIEYGAANVHTQYRPDGISIQDLGGFLDMNIYFNNNNQNIVFPAQSGTLALTSDIVATYKSYVAIVSYDGSLFTQVVLKNDFGSTVFTWSSPSISVFRITPSATSFTVNKTVAFVNSYENNYLVTPKRAFNPSLDYVNLTHIKYDGTSNTMVAGNFFIEIRVYP